MSNLSQFRWNMIKHYKSAKSLDEARLNELLNISPKILAMFAGFVDGDGCFNLGRVSSSNYIKCRLLIQLSDKDLESLEYFRDVFKVGIINHNLKTEVVTYTISTKDLFNIIIPLLVYHNITFLNEKRRHQFNRVLFMFDNNISKFDLLLDNPPTSNYLLPLPETSEGLIELPFFDNWMVGFVMAEGSFFTRKNEDRIHFSISQVTQSNSLIKAIALRFNYIFKVNNINPKSRFNSKNQEYQLLDMSSVQDITSVVKFFSLSGLCPLIGNKGNQYKNWIKSLKHSNRYSAVADIINAANL